MEDSSLIYYPPPVLSLVSLVNSDKVIRSSLYSQRISSYDLDLHHSVPAFVLYKTSISFTLATTERQPCTSFHSYFFLKVQKQNSLTFMTLPF